MGELIRKEKLLPVEQQQGEVVVPEPGKTLYITPKTKGFDYPAEYSGLRDTSVRRFGNRSSGK